jgi:hypothetical protein
MHPEILSITLFGIVDAFTPGPNNFVAFTLVSILG